MNRAKQYQAENQDYVAKGFPDRDAYLVAVSDTFMVCLDEVRRIAQLFGRTEDFDGLVETVRNVSKLPDKKSLSVV